MPLEHTAPTTIVINKNILHSWHTSYHRDDLDTIPSQQLNLAPLRVCMYNVHVIQLHVHVHVVQHIPYICGRERERVTSQYSRSSDY